MHLVDVLHFVTLFLVNLPRIWDEVSFSKPIVTTQHMDHSYRYTIKEVMERPDIFGTDVDAMLVEDLMVPCGDGQDDSSYNGDGELSDGDSFIYDVVTDDDNSAGSGDVDGGDEDGGDDDGGDEDDSDTDDRRDDDGGEEGGDDGDITY